MALEYFHDVTNTRQPAVQNTTSAFMLADVEVRPDSLLLIVGGEHRRVEPRVMDLLVYGSKRAGQLLSRQKILEDVWGETHLVPEALQRVISLLRKSLGDRRNEPIFIETISSKGYRFLLNPQPLPEPGAKDVKLTEKSVRSSPLTLLIAALSLVLLTWFVVNQLSPEEAWAPQADGESSSQEGEGAPPPAADG